jgi:pre-mRNA-processing factor 40
MSSADDAPIAGGGGRRAVSTLPHWMTNEGGENAGASGSGKASSSAAAANERWQTHLAPDGRTYYYDVVTRRSTYAKPEELMTTIERAEAATRWTRYETKDPTTGESRAYWAHETTGETTWETPKEIEEVREIVRRAESRSGRAKTGNGGVSGVDGTERERERGAGGSKTETNKEKGGEDDGAVFSSDYANVEEAKLAFKKMLADHGVRVSTKWEEVLNRTKSDRRFGALKSKTDKKQCLNEYQMAQVKREREAKRMAEKKARESFMAMLEERRVELGITSNTRLYGRDPRIEEGLSEDARWRAVTDRRERGDLFDDFTRSLRVREQREREERKSVTQEAFKECLLDAGADAVTPWRKIYERVKDDPRTMDCEPLDRLEVFEGLVREMREKDIVDHDESLKADAREERRRRQAFVELLEELRRDGAIQPRSRWKSFVGRIENDVRYINACNNVNGSRPRELYEDMLNEMEDEIDAKLDDFEDLLHEGYKARELFGDTTWDKAEKLYRLDKAWKEAPKVEAKKLFDKFIAKVAKREREKARKRRDEDGAGSAGKKAKRDDSIPYDY